MIAGIAVNIQRPSQDTIPQISAINGDFDSADREPVGPALYCEVRCTEEVHCSGEVEPVRRSPAAGRTAGPGEAGAEA